MYQTPPLIPFLKNNYMSAAEISSSSTVAIPNIASQLKAGARNDQMFNNMFNNINVEVGIKHKKHPKAFIYNLCTIDDVYENYGKEKKSVNSV